MAWVIDLTEPGRIGGIVSYPNAALGLVASDLHVGVHCNVLHLLATLGVAVNRLWSLV